MCQFSDEMDNPDVFGTNFPKNGFWGRNFKNLSPNSDWGWVHVLALSDKKIAPKNDHDKLLD